MIRWYKKHFVFKYIGVAHLPVAINESGRMTANKPVMLLMTESGRRKAVVTNRKAIWGMQKTYFDYYYDQQIEPWLHGGPFPKGQYLEDPLAEMLVKIIDNKLKGE